MSKIIAFFLMFFGLFFGFNMNTDYTSSVSKGEKPVIIDDSKEEELIIPSNQEITVDNSEYSNIYKTNVKDLKTIVDNNGEVIIVITGTTCGHCKNYKPVLNEVLKENNLAAYEVDAWTLSSDETKELVKIVGSFNGVPHTVIMKNGDVIGTIEGNQAKENITNILKTNGFIK